MKLVTIVQDVQNHLKNRNVSLPPLLLPLLVLGVFAAKYQHLLTYNICVIKFDNCIYFPARCIVLGLLLGFFPPFNQTVSLEVQLLQMDR